MARKVIWAYAAEEDLEAAASYIHRDSPVYAASFVDRVLEAGRSLENDRISILALIHGRRDFQKAWDEKDR